MYFPLHKLSKEAQAAITEHGSGKSIKVSPHGALMAAWMKGLNIDHNVIAELAVMAHSLRAEDGSIGDFSVPDEFTLHGLIYAEQQAEAATVAATAKEVAAVEQSVSPAAIYAQREMQMTGQTKSVTAFDLASIYKNRAAGL